MSFPTGFVWGGATASYQIEGAVEQDGRGPSVWDAFCQKPGAIHQGNTGEVACDHYNKMETDVELMKQMGLRAYRFSVSWSRVLPEGTGAVNEAGLAFYDRLVDKLLACGITPYLTIFHWDYPLALYNRGGWLNRSTVEWFGEYTRVLADKLGDRVKNWMTLNEPQCFVNIGHMEGRHAPGLKLALNDHLRIAHHALMAHGRAVEVIRERVPDAKVGMAPMIVVKYPGSDKPEDIEAARQMTTRAGGDNTWSNTWYLDPVFKGHYPEDGLKSFGKAMPAYTDADMKLISQPTDFLGINIYSGEPVVASPEGPKPGRVIPWPAGHPRTAFDWPITPDALYWGPKYIYDRYKSPIYITENGLSNIDFVSEDGAVHDPQRVAFTGSYLRKLRDAVNDGTDVRGYFHWSVMDNFEWGEGYKERFGLVHINFQTLKRTPKDSAGWYRSVIENNGANL